MMPDRVQLFVNCNLHPVAPHLSEIIQIGCIFSKVFKVMKSKLTLFSSIIHFSGFHQNVFSASETTFLSFWCQCGANSCTFKSFGNAVAIMKVTSIIVNNDMFRFWFRFEFPVSPINPLYGSKMAYCSMFTLKDFAIKRFHAINYHTFFRAVA